ncbi:OmpP1/FadL family transporter [Aquimarina rhabdastrellae]
MNKYIFSLSLLLVFAVHTYAQNLNSLSSSPYSLYGLGLTNELNTGKTNALGHAGIAIPSNDGINSLNPASYSSIPKYSFFFDVGVKIQKETLVDSNGDEPRLNANFSNIAIAFPINKKSGLGVSLIPYTNVGYTILDIESNIEGSTDTFTTNVFGSGGLNDFKVSYGYALFPKFRLGISGSVLFGEIKETESNIIGSELISLNESNTYSGIKLNAGFQYDITKKLSFGSTVTLPTTLSGSQNTTIFQSDGSTLEIEDDLDDFKLPLELGFGLYYKFNEQYSFNFDYKYNFWETTNQSDRVGTYVDQEFFGLGLEYTPQKEGLKYWQRIRYRAGFNFDNGNLSIHDQRIKNYAFNVGLGLPFQRKRNSMLNISYSYGQQGLVSNGLIQENYHLLSLNLSLEGLWFIKPKFN